jgi:hypothetical protein
MYQDYLNYPWPLSVRSQGKLLSSFNICPTNQRAVAAGRQQVQWV